jgi:hypothetical protein
MGDSDRRVSRRTALRYFGVGAGSVIALGSAGGAAGEESDEEISGPIEQVGPDQVIVRQYDGAATVVHFSDDAVFFKDKVTELDAFEPGDEVSIEGEWALGSFIGSYMMPVYILLEGKIEERTGQRMRLPGKDVLLIPETHAEESRETRAKPIDRLNQGDVIRAMGRVHPQTSELVAMRVGVRR